MKIHILTLYALVLLMLCAVYTVGLTPADEALLRHHCEMVQIYRESNGEYGWPDYNNQGHLCPQLAGVTGNNQRVEP